MAVHTSAVAAGDPAASRRIVIIHGYTGSPDEFREFAEVLSHRLGAYVTIPLLPGHGNEVSDLYPLRFDDLLEYVRAHVREATQGGAKLALIGHSFGAYLATLAAHEFSASALVLTVVPYSLKFPLWIPGIATFARMKHSWK